jgi:hypothetical protein
MKAYRKLTQKELIYFWSSKTAAKRQIPTYSLLNSDWFFVCTYREVISIGQLHSSLLLDTNQNSVHV